MKGNKGSKKIRKNAGRASAAILAMAMLLSGCGGQKKEQTGNDGQAGFAPALDTETEVSLEITGFLGNFEALDQVVNKFNSYYPKVTVTYEQNTSAMLAEYLRSNPYVDIFMTSGENLRYPEDTERYVGSACLDLEEAGIDLSALQTDIFNGSKVDGKALQLPVGESLYGMVVNTTLLEKEGLDIPQDWGSFLSVLDALKQKGYVPVQGAKNHLYAGIADNMAMTLIGTDETLTKQMNDGDPEAAEAMRPVFERLQTLIEKGYTDNEVNAAYPDDNYDQAILKFFEGDVPFWICSSEQMSGMKKREARSESFAANPFEYQFMYVPLGEKGVYDYRNVWYGFSINKDSDVKDYAIEFLRFLAGEDELNEIASVKGIPSIAKKSSDARYQAALHPEKVEKSYINDGKIKQWLENVIRAVSGNYGTGQLESVDAAVEDLAKRIKE